MTKRCILILALALSPSLSTVAQVFMDANSTGDAYARIESKGYGYEVPDCKHAVRHIVEAWDSTLRKNVFVFTLHRDLDDDRCINFDRQRCEIKTWGPSPDSMKGSIGETHTYRWKFKLDKAFQPSSSFTHIHQLKAGDGTYDTDNPIITITPRKGTPNKLEIIYVYPIEKGGSTSKVKTVDPAPFLGTWVEAFETVKYDSNLAGTYALQIRRVNDDSLLLNYTNAAISMWRTGITFVRPKYGIYRSLNNISDLRDEPVFFADFYLQEGKTPTLPEAPSLLNVSEVTSNSIMLTWSDNSTDEILFRVDRSMNGSSWSYLATVSAGTKSYNDTGLTASTKYYYRVRAENTYGNSQYSNTIFAATTGVSDLSKTTGIPFGFSLACYPNPFNPTTTIRYSIPNSANIRISIADILGREVIMLVEEKKEAGIHEVQWNASDFPSGVYICRLSSLEAMEKKMLLLLK